MRVYVKAMESTTMPDHTRGDATRAAADIATTRADIYACFAELWSPADPRSRGGLRGLVERWTAMTEVLNCPEAQGALRCLQEQKDDSDALAKEHHALLCARAGSYLAPFESVNRDATRDDQGGWALGSLRGVPWQQVKVAYRRRGFIVEPDAKLDLDHITVELRYVVALALAEAEALRAGHSWDTGGLRLE